MVIRFRLVHVVYVLVLYKKSSGRNNLFGIYALSGLVRSALYAMNAHRAHSARVSPSTARNANGPRVYGAYGKRNQLYLIMDSGIGVARILNNCGIYSYNTRFWDANGLLVLRAHSERVYTSIKFMY